MSYAVYTTDALVCGTFDHNTADRTYLIFTREVGMLYATARSVREERSRQRYALQDFSHLRLSLVRGRYSWKVGSVEALSNNFTKSASRAARGSVLLIYKLLRRYIQGEEPAPELFDFCVRVLSVLTGEIAADRQFIELYAQLKIMAQLGYVAEETLPDWFQTVDVSLQVPAVSPAEMAYLSTLIERANLHSQL